MKRYFTLLLIAIGFISSLNAKTLIVYYSYTNNVEKIVNELKKQIDADVVRIEPAEKGLDYAANNYAIGSAQIAAIRSNPDSDASYPAIDPVNVDLRQYSTIIVGAPLWWSSMAAPLQTFLFRHGAEMAGKNIGLIVSSASSGISGVETDAKRLIPDGNFLSPSLWIRSSQTSNAGTLIENWLKDIDFLSLSEDEVTYQAIDLGLSVKWADCNVGATVPEGYGGLYGWGDPTGALTSEILADYPSPTPPSSICGTEYDIATAKWGKDWRMPTQAECEELATKCTWEWSTVNGINGMTVTGTNGNSIFLPAGAIRTGSTVSNQVGQRGNYWSGTLWSDNSNFASYLYFYSDASRVQPARSNRRYIGMSVRPVFNDEGAGINDIVSYGNVDFSVTVDGSCLYIENLSEAIPIVIYDIMGKSIYMGNDHQVNVNKSGVYLIMANNITKKVIL